MLITADQIVAHLVGDYILQSDWMATEKTKRTLAAIVHALTYALPFLFFRPSPAAFAFIVVTHFVIDRWRLARYVVWAKNFLSPSALYRCDETADGEHWRAPWDPELPYDIYEERISGRVERRRNYPWSFCHRTGYAFTRPVFMSTWLLIIADNTLHLLCNGIALRWF